MDKGGCRGRIGLHLCSHCRKILPVNAGASSLLYERIYLQLRTRKIFDRSRYLNVCPFQLSRPYQGTDRCSPWRKWRDSVGQSDSPCWNCTSPTNFLVKAEVIRPFFRGGGLEEKKTKKMGMPVQKMIEWKESVRVDWGDRIPVQHMVTSRWRTFTIIIIGD